MKNSFYYFRKKKHSKILTAPARPMRGTLFDVFKKKFSKSLREFCDRLPKRGTFLVTFKKKPGVSVLTGLLLHMQ